MPAIPHPAGLRSGHLHPAAVTAIAAAGFAVHARLGQLVDVRGQHGERYLLGETGDHWTLHLRTTPHAHGHHRNATGETPTHRIPKVG